MAYIQDEPGVTIDRLGRTSRLIIYSVKRAHAGNYTCTASNTVGNDTRQMTLVVECAYNTAAYTQTGERGVGKTSVSLSAHLPAGI